MAQEPKDPKTRAPSKPAATETAGSGTVAAGGSEPKEPITPLERWRMIAEAAYYRAQKRGFLGDNPFEDWAGAEKEIDARYIVDLSRMMTVFDPDELYAQLSKAFSRAQFLGVDLEAVLEGQRKNLEALTAANQRAFEGVQALVARQAEDLSGAMKNATAAIGEVAKAKSSKAVVEKQGELYQQALERTLVSLREASEIVGKAQIEALSTIGTRVADSLAEIRSLAQPMKT